MWNRFASRCTIGRYGSCLLLFIHHVAVLFLVAHKLLLQCICVCGGVSVAALPSPLHEERHYWDGVETRETCRRPWVYPDLTRLAWADWYRRECSRVRNNEPVYVKNATRAASLFALDRYLKRVFLSGRLQDAAVGRVKENKKRLLRQYRGFRPKYSLPRDRRQKNGDNSRSQDASQWHPTFRPINLAHYQCRKWESRPERALSVRTENLQTVLINPEKTELVQEILVSMATGRPEPIAVMKVRPRKQVVEAQIDTGLERKGGSRERGSPVMAEDAEKKAVGVVHGHDATLIEKELSYDLRAGRYQSLLASYDRSAGGGNYTVFLPEDTYEARFEANGARAGQASQTSTQRDNLLSNDRNYDANNTNSGCRSHIGLWSNDTRSDAKCYLDTMADFLHLERPGTTLLDWGSGCGHQLAYLAQNYGISGLGIEPVSQIVDEAREIYEENQSHGHSKTSTTKDEHDTAKHRSTTTRTSLSSADNHAQYVSDTTSSEKGGLRFCRENGVDLSHLPSNSFSHVISYAALYHLDERAQCDVLHQMIRVAQDKVVLGWHVATPTAYVGSTCPFWRRCLLNLQLKTRGLFSAILLVCMPERCLAGASTYSLPFNTIIFQKVYA
ncbi:unnamed protein product [Amoebophrya sp. A25]|nr:unnamed protein product [Amoebophrya sp. A25]|eukprot:GSA25T00016671001.1